VEKDHQEEHARAPVRRRDWRRIHHSPLFWVGFILFLLAISIYLFTEDLSWRPVARPAHNAHANSSGAP
jgi:hypothetical protein